MGPCRRLLRFHDRKARKVWHLYVIRIVFLAVSRKPRPLAMIAQTRWHFHALYLDSLPFTHHRTLIEKGTTLHLSFKTQTFVHNHNHPPRETIETKNTNPSSYTFKAQDTQTDHKTRRMTTYDRAKLFLFTMLPKQKSPLCNTQAGNIRASQIKLQSTLLYSLPTNPN